MSGFIQIFQRLYHAWLRRQIKRIPFGARGQNVEIEPRAIFENPENIFIGNHVYIGHGAAFHGVGGITIGDNVSFSPHVHIHTSNHRYEDGEAIPYDGVTYLKPVRIESHCWVGANVLICPGVTVGEGAVIAMGSVVTRDVAPLTVVGGNPAKPIKERDRDHFERLKSRGRFQMRLKKEKDYPGPRYIQPEAQGPESGDRSQPKNSSPRNPD